MDNREVSKEEPPLLDAGDNVNPAVHIGLFGPVRIVVPQETIYLTGRPAQVVAHLATQPGAAMSAERLLDLLWPVAPLSGLNALQRHVSSIRRSIRDAGLPATHDIIRYRQGTYRLDNKLVRTDLELLDDPRYPLVGPVDELSAADVRWWLDPLMGLPYESFQPIRLSLDKRAISAAKRWLGDAQDAVQVVEAIRNLAERHPNDEILWSRLRSALTQVKDDRVRRDIKTSPKGRHWPTEEAFKARFSGLTRPISLWLGAGVQDALDALENGSDQAREDTTRRATRWFRQLDPTDGMARSLMTEIVARADTNPFDAERALISLDAYSLASANLGLEKAQVELEEAVDRREYGEDHVRSLRVYIFALLGAPPSNMLRKTIEDLESVESLEAQAEAGRFRIAEQIRCGKFDQLEDRIAKVQDQLDDLGPGQDWYRHCIRVALHGYPATRHLASKLEPQAQFLEAAGDQAIVNGIKLWHELYQGETSATTPGRLRQVLNELSDQAGTAYEALYLLATGHPAEASALVRPYRGRLATLPHNTWYHLLPVACGRVALASGDHLLAAEVAAALKPWSGHHLGNFEVIVGPADDFLEALLRFATH